VQAAGQSAGRNLEVSGAASRIERAKREEGIYPRSRTKETRTFLFSFVPFRVISWINPSLFLYRAHVKSQPVTRDGVLCRYAPSINFTLPVPPNSERTRAVYF
jgi:hypothetical protein